MKLPFLFPPSTALARRLEAAAASFTAIPSRRVLDAACKLVLLVLLVRLTFPWLDCLAWTGEPDNSWVMAINQAFHEGKVFGRDIVFTYGPLGFVNMTRDLGSNLIWAVAIRLAVYSAWWVSVAGLTFSTRSVLLGSLLILVVGFSGSGLFLDTVLELACLNCCVLAHFRGPSVWAVLAALLAGLAMLIKVNVGVLCLSCLLVWAMLALGQRRLQALPQVGMCFVACAIAFVALFIASGGDLSAIPDYFRLSLLMASGYSSQMSCVGPRWELILAWIQIGVLAAVVCTGMRSSSRYASLALLGIIPLFLTFKLGFVRHDGHALGFFAALPSLAALFLLLPYSKRGRLGVSAAVVAILGISLTFELVTGPYQDVFPPGLSRVVTPAEWAVRRQNACNTCLESACLLKLPDTMLTKIGTARVDAYPMNASLVLANGLNWQPRPTVQSYVAYVPALDEANAGVYRGPDAPAFILYQHEAVDGQHPFAVDPRTNLELLRWYDLDQRHDDTLLLRRRPVPRFGELELLGQRTLKVGEAFELPECSDGPLFLQADIRLTAVGHLQETLFKVYPPEMDVEYCDGTSWRYRLVWRNAASGFVVSDLPFELSRFESFLKSGRGSPVKSIAFRAHHSSFGPTVTIRWLKLPREE